MKIVFLGTSGWYASAAGNTQCIAAVLEGRAIVFDAGDGLFRLKALCEKHRVFNVDILLSHIHLDHIIGLHILPMLDSRFVVRIFAKSAYLPHLRRLLRHPFTLPLGKNKAKATLHGLRPGKNRLACNALALPLVHADPCLGFRLELSGKTISYCTDTGPCKNILRLAKDADMLITECSLAPGAKLPKDWPHLSPQMAARLAKSANARMLVLSHFESRTYPGRPDRAKALAASRKIFKNTVASTDGLELSL